MVFGDFCQKPINFHKKIYGNHCEYSDSITKIEVKHQQFEIPNEDSVLAESRHTDLLKRFDSMLY